MNKMAIFVEGYTEVVFIDRLIEELANKNSVLIEWRVIRGGMSSSRTTRMLKAKAPEPDREHLVVIFDCGNDDLVKTRIRQEYQNLTTAGYSRIVCLRDVYPTFTYDDIHVLE